MEKVYSFLDRTTGPYFEAMRGANGLDMVLTSFVVILIGMIIADLEKGE